MDKVDPKDKNKQLIVHMQDLTPETLPHVEVMILIFYAKFDFRVESRHSLCSRFIRNSKRNWPQLRKFLRSFR